MDIIAGYMGIYCHICIRIVILRDGRRPNFTCIQHQLAFSLSLIALSDYQMYSG